MSPREFGATTERKPLTKLQRAKMFSDHNGICIICKLPIDEPKGWIDEHIRALALGGTNELSNRGPAHFHCAEVKTRDHDMPRIVKAKAQQAAATSRDPGAGPTIKSAGFKKAEKTSKITDPFPELPRGGNILRRFRSA